MVLIEECVPSPFAESIVFFDGVSERLQPDAQLADLAGDERQPRLLRLVTADTLSRASRGPSNSRAGNASHLHVRSVSPVALPLFNSGLMKHLPNRIARSLIPSFSRHMRAVLACPGVTHGPISVYQRSDFPTQRPGRRFRIWVRTARGNLLGSGLVVCPWPRTGPATKLSSSSGRSSSVASWARGRRCPQSESRPRQLGYRPSHVASCAEGTGV